MKTRKNIYYLLPLLLLSCNGKKSDDTVVTTQPYEIKYARGFEVKKTDDYTQVIIRDPWDTTRYLQKYVLVAKEKTVPEHLPEGTLIRTPIERVVAYASPHCGVLNELGRIKTITGVCESRYIDIPYIRESVNKGSIPDLGEASAPDVERLIELQPEVIMTSPFQHVSYGRVSKTGIPLIECADYMEATPLGRAEWIRFHGLFHDSERLSDSLFNITEQRYNELKARVANTTERPTMFAERKSGQAWFIPGGNSYMANFYRDAGADYLWSDNGSAGSISLSFEEVFDKAQAADYWLLKHNGAQTLTYAQLKQDYRLYGEFEAYKNRNIYVCNSGKVPFYEEMPLHPDRVLADLVWIFHPELMEGFSPRYFKKMEE
ncbi:MAG: ABC transporter substrate-binding protein [Bacteroidales bacterium]